VPLPKLRGATAFIAGLIALVGGLGVAALLRQAPPPAATAAPPADSRAPLLGPRPPDEVPASATFEPQGRQSGSDGAFYVLGIVKNTSPYAVDKPELVVSLLATSGQVLATRQGYAERDLLRPDDTSPIKVLIADAPEHAKLRYRVNARRTLYDPGNVDGLQVEQDGEPEPNFGTWKIQGVVKHTGKVAAAAVKVEVVVRDAAGAMVGLDRAFLEIDKLEPGKTARFSANMLLDQKPAKVELGVSARPAL
jgi:hypothetical protein